MNLCKCGCGEPAPLYKCTIKRRGIVRGEPARFINGHNAVARKRPGFPEGVKVDPAFQFLGEKHRWRIGTGGYVEATIKSNGLQRTIMLHRIVTNCPPDKVVDHINHNKLDNRCENLRVVTRVENQHNRIVARHNTSGFTNVSFCHRRKKWIASVRFDGKRLYLGQFATPTQAADAVAEWRKGNPRAKNFTLAAGTHA